MESQPRILRWVALIQDNFDEQTRAKTLSELFPQHVEFSDERNQFYLTDSSFDVGKSAEEASAHFGTLLSDRIALACTEILTTKELFVTAVHPVFEDGRWGGGQHFLTVSDSLRLRFVTHAPRFIAGDPEEALRNIRREQLRRLELVKSNRCVAYVLKELKKDTGPLGGLTLRNVYEVISDNSNGKKHDYEQQYKAVKTTLNYYHCHPNEVLGKPKPPEATLTLEECESQVRELTEKWVEDLLK